MEGLVEDEGSQSSIPVGRRDGGGVVVLVFLVECGDRSGGELERILEMVGQRLGRSYYAAREQCQSRMDRVCRQASGTGWLGWARLAGSLARLGLVWPGLV